MSRPVALIALEAALLANLHLQPCRVESAMSLDWVPASGNFRPLGDDPVDERLARDQRPV
ncbi:hypothetical protein AGR1B_pAt30317 [Agrobacterium fabacearum S56]|nr:hypothetical protein AGR1B_pAt30317 [Agrobacterium fabacearum S56]